MIYFHHTHRCSTPPNQTAKTVIYKQRYAAQLEEHLFPQKKKIGDSEKIVGTDRFRRFYGFQTFYWFSVRSQRKENLIEFEIFVPLFAHRKPAKIF